MLTITLLSLVIAATSGFFAWRILRREHLRSNARVSSLAAAMDEGGALSLRTFDTSATFDATDDFRSEGREFPSEAPVPAATLTFEAMDLQSSIRRRLLSVLIGAGVVVAGVVVIAMLSDRDEATPTHGVVPTRVVAPHAESLELMSLNASREGSTLVVSGVVRSRSEEPLTAVTAVVSAIDAKDRLVGRGTVPIDAISPHSDSRFIVTIQDVTEAARYRVSFRSATGVIRHVDRRAAPTGNVS
jgi:hypothetical protein